MYRREYIKVLQIVMLFIVSGSWCTVEETWHLCGNVHAFCRDRLINCKCTLAINSSDKQHLILWQYCDDQLIIAPFWCWGTFQLALVGSLLSISHNELEFIAEQFKQQALRVLLAVHSSYQLAVILICNCGKVFALESRIELSPLFQM